MKKFGTQLTGLSLVFAMVFTMFLASCEGPDGPAGPPGGAGNDGKDATAKCVACHSDDKDDVNLAFAQFAYTAKAQGTAYLTTAGRAACGDCHNGDAFRESIMMNKTGVAGIAPIDCKTCHNVHKAMDETDWDLRFNSSFALLYHGTADNGNVDFKDGNLCGKCHQARPYARTNPDFDELSRASATAMYSRFGPHYGTSSNVIANKGLNLIEGTENYPTGNVHGNLANGCVSCHMGEVENNPMKGGHMFKLAIADMGDVAKTSDCSGCHSAGIGNDVANQVKLLLAEYRELLIQKDLLYSPLPPTDPNYNVNGEYAKLETVGTNRTIPRADGDVLLNYMYISRDGSLGTHNPRLVVALLKNGIEYLKK